MLKVNAMGDTCPIPVVKTKEAIRQLGADGGVVETLVDNDIAVQNLTRLAESKGCAIQTEKRSDKAYCVTLTTEGAVASTGDEANLCTVPAAKAKTVVVISADHMGDGSDELGKILLKGFSFALPQQELLPTTVLFDKGGARVTCGTSLNFYGLTDKLQGGELSIFYEIAEKQMQADRILRP